MNIDDLQIPQLLLCFGFPYALAFFGIVLRIYKVKRLIKSKYCDNNECHQIKFDKS